MLIRPREPGDIAACADMVREVHAVDRYPRVLPADLGSFLAPPGAYGSWVAEQNGQVAGHVALLPRGARSALEIAASALGRPADQLAVVARLFVSPHARGRGAGRMLLHAAAAEAASRGLWPVLDVDRDLAHAIALYESSGWVRAGTITVRLPGDQSLAEPGERSMDEYVYLGPGHAGLAAAFTHPGVATAYRHRPPYPDEVFDVLRGLITGRPSRVLDLGAGEGALARPLAARVDHVDAVDISAAMIDSGRGRPGGRAPNLRWIVGAAETAELDGPYALVTAGASLHWMAWRPTLERVAAAMSANAPLAIVDQHYHDLPWRAELTEVITRHSRNRAFDPEFSVAGALSAAGLFRVTGRAETAPARFTQRVADYIEQFHSTASLAREWMPAEEAGAFDRAAQAAVARHASGGMLDMAVVAEVTWGRITVARDHA